MLDPKIDELDNLEELNLENNNLKQPPQRVCNKGVDCLFEYLFAWKSVQKSATKVYRLIKIFVCLQCYLA